MIGCRRCKQRFAPTPAAYVGTQLYTDSTLALFNCPNIDERGEICGSTAALVLWRGFEDEDSEAQAAE